MAERINELEKQQQQQQVPNKFTYFDPEKKHKVADNSLRAIQKRALLSFYERHQPGSAWRSEPQLSPPPRPPPIPSRPRLPTPQSRRSSISSEYDTPATWNDVSIFRTPVPRMPVASSVKYSHGFLIKIFFFPQDCSKDDSSADDVTSANSPKELNKNQHRRYIYINASHTFQFTSHVYTHKSHMYTQYTPIRWKTELTLIQSPEGLA